jgi:DNA-binding NarL/FixJ family response regulator
LGVTRFLIVEDHPLFLEALENAICMANADADVLHAATIDEALDILSTAPPVDLVLLDLSMPGTTGLSGVIRIRKAFPKSPVVIVSAHQNPQIIDSVLSLGVSGYIPKSMTKSELAHSISEVLRGAVYLPKEYREFAATQQPKANSRELLMRIHDLTPQQLRVLELLRSGLQNKQIAHELKICETTVKVHVSEILRKLNVLSRTNAIIEASKIDFENLIGEPAAGRSPTQQPTT